MQYQYVPVARCIVRQSEGEKMNPAFKQAALSWFRAAAAAAVALYVSGITDPKQLGSAALAGLAGPLLKWLDPSATEFGRGSE